MTTKPKRKNDDKLLNVFQVVGICAVTTIAIILLLAMALSMPIAPEMNCSTTTLRDDCPLNVRPLQLNDRLRDANAPLDCLNPVMQGEC